MFSRGRPYYLLIPVLLIINFVCSNSKKVQSDNTSYNRVESQSKIPPGSAKVKAVVKDVNSAEGNPLRCNIDIIEIIEYGHSTPPLAVGTIIQINLPNTFTAKNTLKKDSTYTLLIKYTEEKRVNEDNSTWSVLRIE